MSDIKTIKKELMRLQKAGETKITLTINEVLDIINNNIQLETNNKQKTEKLNNLWSL